MICKYTEAIVGNNMNIIRKKRLDRETILLAKLTEYSNLTIVQKIKNLEYYMLEFGCYTSENLSANFFKKIPEPDIQELLDNSMSLDYSFQEMVSSF